MGMINANIATAKSHVEDQKSENLNNQAAQREWRAQQKLREHMTTCQTLEKRRRSNTLREVHFEGGRAIGLLNMGKNIIVAPNPLKLGQGGGLIPPEPPRPQSRLLR